MLIWKWWAREPPAQSATTALEIQHSSPSENLQWIMMKKYGKNSYLSQLWVYPFCESLLLNIFSFICRRIKRKHSYLQILCVSVRVSEHRSCKISCSTSKRTWKGHACSLKSWSTYQPLWLTNKMCVTVILTVGEAKMDLHHKHRSQSQFSFLPLPLQQPLPLNTGKRGEWIKDKQQGTINMPSLINSCQFSGAVCSDFTIGVCSI